MFVLDTSTHAIHVRYYTDLSGIQCLLKRNNSGDPINSLCTTTPEGTYEIKGFSAVEAVYPYVEKFFIISSRHARMPECQNARMPECQNDSNDSNKVLTLFESFWLETLSQVVSNNEAVTFQQVVDLVWNNEEVKNFHWIKGVCNRIWHYWNSCNIHQNATSFLDICERLGVTGDSILIESIANKVNS